MTVVCRHCRTHLLLTAETLYPVWWKFVHDNNSKHKAWHTEEWVNGQNAIDQLATLFVKSKFHSKHVGHAEEPLGADWDSGTGRITVRREFLLDLTNPQFAANYNGKHESLYSSLHQYKRSWNYKLNLPLLHARNLFFIPYQTDRLWNKSVV